MDVEDIFEEVVNDARIIKKVEKAINVFEETYKSTCSQNTQEVLEHLSNHVEKDFETQMGLMVLSENFYPVPMVENIIPENCLQSEMFSETIGTIVMASLIEKDHGSKMTAD